MKEDQMSKYEELNSLQNMAFTKQTEAEQVCGECARRFGQGLIDYFQWPPQAVCFIPVEGNPHVKLLEKGSRIPIADGPRGLIHYKEGFWLTGYDLLINPHFFIIVIRFRKDDDGITVRLADKEVKAKPGDDAPFTALYEELFNDIKHYFENYPNEKPRTFGFR
jgi:hypothetical protein